MSSTPTLPGLPLELFEEAASYLSKKDLKALRHVSRVCAIKVGSLYAKRVHYHNSFTLRDESDMRRALMMARHHLIGPALRKITIFIDETKDAQETMFVDRRDDAKMLTVFFELLQVAGAKVEEVKVKGTSRLTVRSKAQKRTAPENGDLRAVKVVLRALAKSGVKPSAFVIRGGEWRLPVREIGKDSEAMEHFRGLLESVEWLRLDVHGTEESTPGVQTFAKAVAAAPKLATLYIVAPEAKKGEMGPNKKSDGFLSSLLRQKMPLLGRLGLAGGYIALDKLEAHVKAHPPSQTLELDFWRFVIRDVGKLAKPGEGHNATVRRVLRAAKAGPVLLQS